MTEKDHNDVIRAMRDEIIRLQQVSAVLEQSINSCAKREVRLKEALHRKNRIKRFITTARDLNGLKTAKARSRLAAIVESSELAIISKTLDGTVLSWNRGAEKLYGYGTDEVVGRPYTFLIPPGHPDPFPELAERIARGDSIESYETEKMTKDGSRIHVLQTLSAIRDERNTISGISTIAYDITARRYAEAALKEAVEKLNSTLESITDGYLKLGPRWDFQAINPVAEKIFGPAEEVIGTVCWKRYPQTVGSEFYRQLHIAAKEKVPVHFESRSVISGRWYETHAYPRGTSMEVYFRDITDRKRFEEEIRHLAYHDLLTGLPNRKLLMDLAAVEVAHARRNRQKIGVLFLDLDGFKGINDRFGHAAGDLMLKDVAQRLKKRMRDVDIVSRVGGDEFMIILPDITYSGNVAKISGKIIKDLGRPYMIHGKAVRMTTSIGISIFPDDSDDIDTLGKYADIAMYHAKQQGRNRCQFYNPAFHSRIIERIRSEKRLKQGLENNELVLYYQPQRFGTKPGIACAEVLLRWQHPEHGLLIPEQFVPLAEETGLIIPIGAWVIRTACEQNRKWQASGYPAICLALNLSDRQFQHPGLAEATRDELERNGLDPQYLEYEITESVAMRDLDFSLLRLRQLSAMGVRLSLDDFGIGFGCLSYLLKLPFQKLKIDRSFIRGLESDSPNLAIVSAATALARSLRIEALAEGVETEAEFELLRQYDCTNIQGFFFSGPLPADRFEQQFLRQRTA